MNFLLKLSDQSIFVLDFVGWYFSFLIEIFVSKWGYADQTPHSAFIIEHLNIIQTFKWYKWVIDRVDSYVISCGIN